MADYTSVDKLESLSVRVMESPAGKQGAKAKVTVVIPEQLRERQEKLRNRDLSEEELIEFGEDLAKLLLPPGVQDFYYRSRAKLRAQEGLRIQICTDQAELGELPWEYTYVWSPDTSTDAGKHSGFLALDREISIVRYQNLRDVKPPPGSEVVRVAALFSDGREAGYRELELAREEDNLRQALIGVGGVELCPIRNGKLEGLLDSLTRDGAQVFHFSGHGTIKKEPLEEAFKFREQIYLVLVAEDGGEQLWSGQKVVMELGKRGVLLVVLSACDSGLSGLVPELVNQGIPAVVGMQFTVRDANAVAFSHRFYQALASGKSIDTAVSEGRHGIYQRPIEAGRDWGVPVLYLQTDYAVLFPKPVKPMLINLALLCVSLGALGAWFALHILPVWNQAVEEIRVSTGFALGAIPSLLAFIQLVASRAMTTMTGREQSSWSERLLGHRFARRILASLFFVAIGLAVTTHSIYMANPPGTDPIIVNVFKSNNDGSDSFGALPVLSRDENGTRFGGPVFFQFNRQLKLEIETAGWQFDEASSNVEVDSGKLSSASAHLAFWKSINFSVKEKELKVIRLVPDHNLVSLMPDHYDPNPEPLVRLTLTVGEKVKYIEDFREGVVWVGAPMIRLVRKVTVASESDLKTTLISCLDVKSDVEARHALMAKWDSKNYYLDIELNNEDEIVVEAELKYSSELPEPEFESVSLTVIPPTEELPGGSFPTVCLKETL